jgi:hypothetical protein
MIKRFLTYFGIAIPPWRAKKMGAGAVTIRFVIKGTVPSKKNNQQAICVRKDAYKYLDELFAKKKSISKAEARQAIQKVRGKMRGNDAYRAFLEAQKPVMEAQRAVWLARLQEKGLVFPISAAALNIRFYFAQRYRQDSVNKQQSVQDLLKDCMIIADDDYTTLNPITAEADCYHEEIAHNLTVVSLTFQL